MDNEFNFYSMNAIECSNNLNNASKYIAKAQEDLKKALDELNRSDVNCALSNDGIHHLNVLVKKLNKTKELVKEGQIELLDKAKALDIQEKNNHLKKIEETKKETINIDDNSTIVEIADNNLDNAAYLTSGIVGLGTIASISKGINKVNYDDDEKKNNRKKDNKPRKE